MDVSPDCMHTQQAAGRRICVLAKVDVSLSGRDEKCMRFGNSRQPDRLI